MLKYFLNLWEPIRNVINVSKSKALRNIKVFSSSEIEYLKSIYNILSIFIKATIKLQGEKYPTIYYILPEIYIIYSKLDKFKIGLKVCNIYI